ncbi:unnamed protein product [Blepharisma stoltei]|uniref:EGF-like domain-containing protein n=1 Tax=Blepharisma stoltei TaxID=1481888 RepID=A0AAU9JRF5_9CILI|nr:unnamed protein product [Blepharisma stoltei]
MNSRKLKENATSDAPGNWNKRQLFSQCTNDFYGCLKCNGLKTYCSTCKNAGGYPNKYGGCTTVCSANHYLSCLPCSDLVENCNTCSSIDECYWCEDGYYLNSNKCYTCSSKYENCKICNPNSCYKCISGFAFDEYNNCVPSPTPICSHVKNGICNKCELGYYLESKACLSCSIFPNCDLWCDSWGCTQCLPGFIPELSSSSCISCSTLIPFCLVCSSISRCTQCDSKHYLTDKYICADSGPDNCNIVQSADLSNCVKCLKGYNWDKNHKICKPCGDIMLHCAECEEGNIEDIECLKCDAGYVLDPNGVCIKSPLENCKAGLDAYHCDKCLQFYGEACVSAGAPIANCKIASTESSYCVDCILGYSHTEEGLCECRAEYCTTCNTDDGSICDTCIDNYYGDCVACSAKIPNCDTCVSGVCTKCSAGYYLFYSQCRLCTEVDANCITCIDNDRLCASCKPGFLSTGYGSCIASSVPNCDIAYNSARCTICLPGYYLNDQNTCSSCGAIFAGCNTCSGSSKCLECSPGYWLNSNSCLPCSSIPNCQTCTDSTKCTKCKATYLLNENKSCTSSSIENCDVVVSNNPSTCQQCSKGCFWDSTKCNACSVSLPNCDTCSSSTTCSLCKTGYCLNFSQCSLCRNALENCLECSLDGSSCLKCDSGYYPNHENKCTKSFLNSCAKVSDDGTCIACPSDKIFACTNSGASLPNCVISSSDSSVCVKCKPSYENQGGTCVKLYPDNCSAWTSVNVCTICDSGYFLYDSKEETTCISCTDSCEQCGLNPTCFICTDLVVQDGSTCRVDQAGYKLSISGRYIIINFAHSSSRIFTIASITAFKNNNQNIDTTNWFISSRSDAQMQIQTDNVRISDLPINIKISLL